MSISLGPDSVHSKARRRDRSRSTSYTREAGMNTHAQQDIAARVPGAVGEVKTVTNELSVSPVRPTRTSTEK